jgi:predicted dienelactone hydrolase
LSRFFAAIHPVFGAATLAFALTFAGATLGAVSASAQVPDPGVPGPFVVGTSGPLDIVDGARGNRTLPIHIWWPSDDAMGAPLASYPVSLFALQSSVAYTDAPGSAAGPFPLLVFSHGSGGLGLQSWRTMEVLASHGFVVATLEHVGNTSLPVGTDMPYENTATDRPKDVSFVIDNVIALAADNLNPYFGLVDDTRIGVLGHSFGGFTSIAMVAGYVDDTYGVVAPDPRVDAIMPIAGVTGLHSDAELAAIDEPSLFLGGTLDDVVPIVPSTTRAVALMSENGSPLRADIIGANHNHFAAVCDLGQLLIDAGIAQSQWASLGAGALIEPYNTTCIPGVLDIDEAVRIQNVYAVSFFRSALLGDTDYDAYLTQAYAETEPNVAFWVNALPVPILGGAGVGLLAAALGWTAVRRARSTR